MPLNSQHLNPVDYKVMGSPPSVCKTRIRDVNHFKECLIEEWASFDQKIIDGSIRRWHKRLRACKAVDYSHSVKKYKPHPNHNLTIVNQS